jgi:hypothetical protein
VSFAKNSDGGDATTEPTVAYECDLCGRFCRESQQRRWARHMLCASCWREVLDTGDRQRRYGGLVELAALLTLCGVIAWTVTAWL